MAEVKIYLKFCKYNNYCEQSPGSLILATKMPGATYGHPGLVDHSMM